MFFLLIKIIISHPQQDAQTVMCQMRMSSEMAAVKLQGFYKICKAKHAMDHLRELRSEKIRLLLQKPQMSKLGGKHGFRAMFNAPFTRSTTKLGSGSILQTNDQVSETRVKVIHPDISWLARGLELFYNKYNREAVKNIKKIAATSAGHSQELRIRLMKKYPCVPNYEFNWLLYPPSAVEAEPQLDLDAGHSIIEIPSHQNVPKTPPGVTRSKRSRAKTTVAIGRLSSRAQRLSGKSSPLTPTSTHSISDAPKSSSFNAVPKSPGSRFLSLMRSVAHSSDPGMFLFNLLLSKKKI